MHLDKVGKDIKELNSKGMKLKEIILEIISTSITITYMDDKSCYKKLLAKGGKETLRRISKDIFYKYYKDYKVTIIE